jgi:ribosomal protein L16
MLMPKRTKYRKHHRGRMTGTETRGAEVQFGEFGLQTLEPAWITSRQIEAARKAMSRSVRRGGQLWIRTRILGCRHQARSRHFRNERCRVDRSSSRYGPCRAKTADQMPRH